MKIRNVQLITTTTAVGRGANDGIYPPGGLLTIANAIQQNFPTTTVSIHDQHHQEVEIDPTADVIGIQVASTLCYRNSLESVSKAKQAGKPVILGGPHVTALYKQIMQNQPQIDYAIRGKGEKPMVELLKALARGSGYDQVPYLSWRNKAEVIHNPSKSPLDWKYDDYTPLPLQLLSSGIEEYWQAFRKTINSSTDAAFLLFTHYCPVKIRTMIVVAPPEP